MKQFCDNFDYQIKIDELREILGCDFISLAIAKSASEGSEITWQYASGNLNDRYKRIVLHSGKGIAGIVFKTGKKMVVDNVEKEMHDKELFNYPILVSERLHSLVAFPLYQYSRVAGVLLVGYREEQRLKPQLYDELNQQCPEAHIGAFEIKGLSV
ncbi:GAF domain-containing protein [Paenibacillus sp. FSL W7-1287]|uniref:GAF domain-containing protein n=1 Tax=Paenibacillus sp. FSL W7-1287 TaxID=2954538 RepID=UPI0030F7C314